MIIRILTALAVVCGISMLALAAALVLGGPATPPPMASVEDPFAAVDFSDLPPVSRFRARDGTELAYRAYRPYSAYRAYSAYPVNPPGIRPMRGSVVLIHGSSASSASMHVLAKAFAQEGYAAYALDIRGHGDSGEKGRIAYVGQLDDDLEDFVRATPLARPVTLVGFSSGGGFALRIAGGRRQGLFDNYLFLAPYLGQSAPTYRPEAGGWVRVGVPRIVALRILERIGVRWFDDLPVVRFALAEKERPLLTPKYSLALVTNFGPRRDYRRNIEAIREPCSVVDGSADEVFRSDRFAEVFRAADKSVPVTLVPEVDHVGLILDRRAIAVEIAAVDRMDGIRAAGRAQPSFSN